MSGTLRLVATPIGNLEDVTLRALRVLREAACVLCEDTRTTRKLLARHGIEARLVSCHEHNETRRAREVVAALGRGEDVALVTDAGTPGVSDPGMRIVAAAVRAGARVEAVPGASAALVALAASGFPADRFRFLGFPPSRGAARADFLREAAAEADTTVLFESPHRIGRTLAELAEAAPLRAASLHREMTKLHEETVRGTLAEVAAAVAAGEARGEYTIVLAPAAPAAGGGLDAAVEAARARVAAGETPSAAARESAREHGAPRRQVYRALLGGRDEEE